MALTEQERMHIGRLIKEAAAKDRGYASFFEWPEKDQKEVGELGSGAVAMRYEPRR